MSSTPIPLPMTTFVPMAPETRPSRLVARPDPTPAPLAPRHEARLPEVTTDPIPGLDPGIRRVVAWLRSHGFRTTDSGDGVSKAGMDCALDYPHVFMTCHSHMLVEETDRLARLLRRHFLSRIAPEGMHVEASYSPTDGIAIIALRGLDDAHLP